MEKQLGTEKSQLRGIRSLNKMQQYIIRIMVQYADGPWIESNGVLSKWRNICGVVARENTRSSSPGMMFQKTCKKHYEDSSKNITFFPSEEEQVDKNATMKTTSNALWRFKHALNEYYVQRGLSPLNQFGYITPNK
jgi:hypothetical protein